MIGFLTKVSPQLSRRDLRSGERGGRGRTAIVRVGAELRERTVLERDMQSEEREVVEK
jgi:hypothetical protein